MMIDIWPLIVSMGAAFVAAFLLALYIWDHW